ncbi:MAG: hypothetical protein GY933_16185 [Hyphomicrobiales bacterium]|nr:hypothetical protein [Hyphomicrobiales bacterium]
MKKYLLCRPKGGLNDTLCQIERCWQYAEQHHRTLIVDTTRSCFAGEFSNFFEPTEASDKIVFAQTDELLGVLNNASCFPPEVEGNL